MFLVSFATRHMIQIQIHLVILLFRDFTRKVVKKTPRGVLDDEMLLFFVFFGKNTFYF